MTSRIEGGITYTQTFDAENRLISVTASSATTQFIYNGDGNPTTAGLDTPHEHELLDPPLTIVPEAKRSGRVGVGGIYEVDKTSSGTVTGTKG